MTITFTTRSPVTGQEYRISDARSPEIFSSYGSDGAGFGYLTFQLRRRTGRDYPDIGHGYTVHVTKGPWKTLFHGQITKITEQTGDSDSLTVWCLGWVHLLGADTFNRVYCDTRLSAWVADEEPVGDFRPDLFEWSTEDDAITIMPRTNAEYEGTEYTALLYAFNFGETLERIKFDYDISIPAEWAAAGGGLRLELVDSDGEILWFGATDGTGSLDLPVTSEATWIEARLYFTGAGQHTRTEEDVYGQLSGIRIYSAFVQTLDAAVIAKDLVAYLGRSGDGLNASTALIQSPGLGLEPSVFVNDQTPLDILSWCCRFGNIAGLPVAFGVTFDDTKRLFLEPWDLTSIRYVVKPNRVAVERTGDWSESAQKVYGVVNTQDNGVVRTTDMEATATIAKMGGHYRRESVALDGVGSVEELGYLTQLYLSERQHPASSGSYTVKGSVQTPSGREVPVEELVPGGLVQVQEWRAREATLSPDDYRDQTTTFMLVGVRVNLETREAELSPSETSDSFARAMAIIQELKRGR